MVAPSEETDFRRTSLQVGKECEESIGGRKCRLEEGILKWGLFDCLGEWDWRMGLEVALKAMNGFLEGEEEN